MIMCRNCFEYGIYGFETATAFTIFDGLLTQKLSAKHLLATGRPSPKPPVAYDADESYECQSCQEFWLLAAPDNAWRGYFLPAKKALTYQTRLQRRDKRIKSISAFVLLLLLAILIEWLLH